MIDSGDARQAALQRLTLSRERLGSALQPTAPRSSAFALRSLLRSLRAGGARALGANRLAPWIRRQPVAALGLAAAGGAALYLARGWLLAAGLLQARRWWQLAKGLLLQQAINVALDPQTLQSLLAALPPSPPPPGDEALAAKLDRTSSEPASP